MNTEPKLYPDGIWARPIDKEKDARATGDELLEDNGKWLPIQPEFYGQAEWAVSVEYRRPVPAPERRKDAVEQGVPAAEQWRCGAYAEHGLGPDGKGCPLPAGHDGNHGSGASSPAQEKPETASAPGEWTRDRMLILVSDEKGRRLLSHVHNEANLDTLVKAHNAAIAELRQQFAHELKLKEQAERELHSLDLHLESAQAACKAKDEALEEEGRWLVGLLDFVKGNGDRPPSLYATEEYLSKRCRRPNPALRIQPSSSGPPESSPSSPASR